ncbi:RNA polymerase Rpc34 [Spinellus fusiger]|nr:RNA polymerase Rpc34 [Spinellus fusiger]
MDGLDPTSEGKEPPLGLSPTEWKYYEFVKSHEKGVGLSEHPADMDISEAHLSMNSLLKKSALEIITLNGETLLRAIDLNIAEKAGKLNEEGRLVFNAIRAAGNTGIWTKDLKKKTNLHMIVVNRALKALEQKHEIKAIKHVKYPTRKIYMLFNLTPSSEVTGGACLKVACLKYITARSFPRLESVRDATFGTDHEHYPTSSEVRRFITESRISSIELSVKDITSLLDVLVYDGSIEKKLPYAVGMEDFSDDEDTEDASIQWCYKAVRKVNTRLPSAAWTELPCGRCPVYSACTDEGIISPSKCEYFNMWFDW